MGRLLISSIKSFSVIASWLHEDNYWDWHNEEKIELFMVPQAFRSVICLHYVYYIICFYFLQMINLLQEEFFR